MHLQTHETDQRPDSTIALGNLLALDLEAALRHWADPVALVLFDELKDYVERPKAWPVDDPNFDRYIECWKRRRRLEEQLLARIRRGELVLTGLAAPISLTSRREVIPPDIVEVLEIGFADAEATAPGLRLIRLKVHDARCEPEATPSGWDGGEVGRAVASAQFRHNGDYSRVVMRGSVFDLSGGLCQVVGRLHAASLGADPWLIGKQLMAECGYGFALIGDAFKRHQSPSWRELIEGNGRGLYRLNLHSA